MFSSRRAVKSQLYLRRLAIQSLSLVNLGALEISAQALGAQELRLDQVATVSVPTRVVILGGVLSSSGNALLWSDDAIWLLEARARVLTRLCKAMPLEPQSAWFGDTRDHYWVADGKSKLLLDISTREPCIARSVQPIPDSALFAIGVDTTARMLERRGAGALAITWLGRPREVSVIGILPQATVRLGSTPLYIASTAQSELLITERLYPFRSLAPDGRGHLRVLLDPTRSISAVLRASLSISWRSLRVVALEGGRVLQVLADTRSDERRTFLFNGDGALLRTRSLDVAFGILDSDPAQRRLIALRNTGKREIVFYNWRWQANDSTR